MSSVRLEKQTFDLAPLGEENPLPDFHNVSYVHSSVEWDDSLTQADTRYMRYGRVSSILPYRAQDGYSRERRQEERSVVVLENDFVRAQFLPWMGGRLRSLQCQGREMLHVNPVIQPCNLALRNAWCSGGVEWNVGIRGHHMLTNSPLFTEFLRLPDGTCGIRFYEYERIRGIVHRLEAYLPPESRFLYVQVHLENPVGNGETPMYWWSNMAVPEEKGTRVIAPADTAVLSLYDAGKYRMLRTPLPVYEDMDLSRPAQIGRSLDVFFDIREGEMPFVAALQSDHQGLVQCSTGRMRGRKLFVWGMGQGGRHWQKFLSDGRENYIEIQAGIAKTQQDHLPMPENASWAWLEAYGSLQCNVEGLSYREAAEACARALEKSQSREGLEKEFAGRGAQIAEAAGEQVLSGSGWGALENLRRKKAGLPPLSRVCLFPEDSLGEAQRPWRMLLDTGSFPEGDQMGPESSFMIRTEWINRLKEAPPNSASLYQMAVALYAQGRQQDAQRCLERSLQFRQTPWALRARGRMRLLAGEEEAGLSDLRRALALAPGQRQLSLEYARALLESHREDQLIAFLDALPQNQKSLPRFLYLRACADTALGRYEEAEKILLSPLIIPDMREGELSLCDLWYTLRQKQYGLSRREAERRFPLPEALDFRMH